MFRESAVVDAPDPWLQVFDDQASAWTGGTRLGRRQPYKASDHLKRGASGPVLGTGRKVAVVIGMVGSARRPWNVTSGAGGAPDDDDV